MSFSTELIYCIYGTPDQTSHPLCAHLSNLSDNPLRLSDTTVSPLARFTRVLAYLQKSAYRPFMLFLIRGSKDKGSVPNIARSTSLGMGKFLGMCSH